MSLIRVYVDGALFYHPHLSQLALTDLEVTEDAESIDSLKMSCPCDHPYITAIKPIQSLIEVKRDDQVVFRGRALDDGTDFYNTHTWSCESCLAFLKDTMQPPFDYQGPLKTMLQTFLDQHNAHVEDAKKFTLGTVTVEDSNDYIHYSSENYLQTLSAIQQKLIETHGGYLRIRFDGSTNILDYLKDFDEASVQKVEYGKNLLDVSITRDHSARVSALIPFGAVIDNPKKEVGQADQRIDITSVNSEVNYVYDQSTVNEIGWIWAMEAWDDVTLPENLLKKAKQRLNELKDGVISMELSVVDESFSGADISIIHAREYVDCTSAPHGIDGRYLVTSKVTDYVHPSNNKLTIGCKGITLSQAVAKAPKQGPQGKPGADGKDGVVLKISSSKGLIFKNNLVSTILSVTVFYGENQITTKKTLQDSFGDTACLQWQIQNKDSDTVELIPDTDGRIGADGFTFSVSPSDIDSRATVTCSLNV